MKAFLFVTVLFSGLVAGLLYAYSCSVNPGLKSLPDVAYIRAMQSINLAIQNPIFFITFMGLLLVFPITAYQLQGQPGFAFNLFLGAMVVYFVGVFGVTIFCNVPLNEQLAKFPITTATENEIVAARQAFETPWNFYHTIRTIASVLSFALVILSLARQNHTS